MPPKGGPSKGSPKSRGNKAITSFFKPASSQPPPQRAQTPKPKVSPKASPDTLASQVSSSSPSLPELGLSSPATKVQAPPPPRPDVIAASDEDVDEDDDGSSDGGFMDLMATFDGGKTNATRSFDTPKAKRTMNEFHSSPLTINTKPRAMFDMRALARDAKIDDATKASSAQLRELIAETEDEESATNTEFGTAFKDIVQDQSGQNAHKVMRAVHRVGDQATPHFRFFKSEFEPRDSVPAPTKAKNGPWKLLVHDNLLTREQYVASGMPVLILEKKKKELPSDVFQWVLDDLSIQRSRILGQEYCRIISSCPGQVAALLTPSQLERMFTNLGAVDKAARRESSYTGNRQEENPYHDRDWGSLRYFLRLLAKVAQFMSMDAICYASRTLLHLSMDGFLICNIGLLAEFEAAMRGLLSSLSFARWDAFCLECCKALHTGFKTQSIRLNALLALPVDKRRAHDLRRRLAVTFLFEDHSLGNQNPGGYMTIRRIIDRLDQKDFFINGNTDFDQFRAKILMMDMVIDDGSFIPNDIPDADASFNKDVDELASKLSVFCTKINDSGLKLNRAQTKSVIEWVRRRVSVSVRTHRKVKKDIYDAVLGDDPFLPKQQTMMKEFLGKKIRD